MDRGDWIKGPAEARTNFCRSDTVGPQMSFAKFPAKYWSERAVEARSLAERAQDAETKRAVLLMADGYERLARYTASLEAGDRLVLSRPALLGWALGAR